MFKMDVSLVYWSLLLRQILAISVSWNLEQGDTLGHVLQLLTNTEYYPAHYNSYFAYSLGGTELTVSQSGLDHLWNILAKRKTLMLT